MAMDRIVTECVSTPECTLYSEVLKLDWNYSIYLPRGYDSEENRLREYPVIYFLHGAFGNHRNFVERIHMNRMLEKLAEGKQAGSQGTQSADAFRFPDVIGVFVDGFNSFYFDGPGVKMESAVIQDLIPKIESMYRVKKDRSSRMICGISMGGFGSARFALKYPELFSACVMVSPAVYGKPKEDSLLGGRWRLFADESGNFSQEFFDRESPASFFDVYSAKKTPVGFYISTGDADLSVPVEDVRTFARMLGKIADVEYCEVPGAGHMWPFWREAFYGAFASDIVRRYWAV